MKTTKSIKEIATVFASINNPKEFEYLLVDILTPSEIEMLGERWETCKLIAQDKPHREIAKKLGISISKVTRGSRVMKYGTGILKKLVIDSTQ